MYILEKLFTFEAAHRLPDHDGKCRRLHGHSFRGLVRVGGEVLTEAGPKAGMLVDYGDLKAALEPIIERYLDHHYLNESIPLEVPTSEKLAEWLFYQLTPRLQGLLAVVIEETCTTRCEYRGPRLGGPQNVDAES